MRREKKDQILAVLPEKIRGILLNHGLDFEKIQEIRLREEQPLAVKKEGKEELFTHRVTKEELRETMEYVSNYSLYAYENELRQGFLTIEGGHRVGISGKIISEKEQIRNFQYITSVNIRICHEITGCANKLFPVILEKGRLCHTMIISPPGGGRRRRTKKSNKLKIYAMNAIDNAYAPYSDFKVGACVELTDGQYITGSNVENASYGLSNCAERSAIFAAYSRGYRKEDIKAMAIATHAEKLTMPCGACRQVLSELLLPDTPILIANDKEEKILTMRELLPYCFGEDDLKK